MFSDWNSFHGYDEVRWTHGTHSVKFGGTVERMTPTTKICWVFKFSCKARVEAGT
jgi:hypothetical protein